MTREEAYNRIDAIIARHEIDDDYVTITSMLDYDALRLARKLLEQEPCSDAISRKAVHIELEKWINNGEYNYSNATKYLYDRIDRLPPVNPQPKTGHWIDVDGIWFKCSECDAHRKMMPAYKEYYCPNCGCLMDRTEFDEYVKKEGDL